MTFVISHRFLYSSGGFYVLCYLQENGPGCGVQDMNVFYEVFMKLLPFLIKHFVSNY